MTLPAAVCKSALLAHTLPNAGTCPRPQRDAKAAEQLGLVVVPRTCGNGGDDGHMFRGKRVIVVMPAYNSGVTLQRTHDEVMAQEIVDRVIVVDDGSRDDTSAIARSLPNTR